MNPVHRGYGLQCSICQASSLNEPFIEHAQERIVEDQKSNTVDKSLGQDQVPDFGGESGSKEPQDADKPSEPYHLPLVAVKL
jgi:hypothetical protein